MRALQGFIFVLVFLSVAGCANPKAPFDEARWRKDVENVSTEKLYAPHYRNGKYFNPWMPRERGGLLRFLKWRLSGSASYTPQEKAFKPGFIPGLKDRIRAMPSGDFIAWVGHGTFLMRLDGEYWLTDPIFTKRALLPKRVTPPALTAEDIREIAPRVNVIISHNHYDHLDADSIRALPETARIIVPRGLKTYVASLHRGEVTEMDWWEKIHSDAGTTLTCLPAQHWSRRIGQGVNETLWASFMIVAPGSTIYYGADSGYFVGYREFGRLYPNIGYALISTTAYHPRWFMHYAHVNIPESLDAFRDLGARYFVPTQWGAFHLGEEPPGYPALDLNEHIRERKLDPSRFLIMDIGQIHRMAERTPREPDIEHTRQREN